ncbi:MAG: hypothetical protein EP338_02440 [Bacteroidetes bacterium]|nr:MAG: hypothetical protein EP338_02440 [Bacteroidota bacterium]
MKTYFLPLLLSIFVSLSMSAQTNNTLVYDEFSNTYHHYFSPAGYIDYIKDNQYQKYLRKNKIQSIQEESSYYNKRGKKDSFQKTSTFNRLGKTLQIKREKSLLEYQYENDSLPIYICNQWKKRKIETKITYNRNHPVLIEKYAKGKLSSSILRSFNEHGKLLYSIWIDGRMTREVRYTYDESGRKTRTLQFRNGKLKKSWIHECKEEGELASNKKELLSSVCEYREESADGSFTIFQRSIRNGKSFLLKQHFNRDTVKLSSEYFVHDTVLISSNHYNIETRTWTNQNFKKGKLTQKGIVVRDEKNRIIKSEWYNGKNELFRRESNEWSEDNRIGIRIVESGKKLKHKKRTENKFNEQGIIVQSSTFQNDRLTREHKYNYSFF